MTTINIADAQFWVHDQDAALDFYTGKLGWEVRADVTMPAWSFRWLCVTPPAGDGPALVLMPVPGQPMLDEVSSAQLPELVAKGAVGTLFLETDDCRAAYDELSARGVESRSADGAAVRDRHIVPGSVGQQHPAHAGAGVRSGTALTRIRREHFLLSATIGKCMTAGTAASRAWAPQVLALRRQRPGRAPPRDPPGWLGNVAREQTTAVSPGLCGFGVSAARDRKATRQGGPYLRRSPTPRLPVSVPSTSPVPAPDTERTDRIRCPVASSSLRSPHSRKRTFSYGTARQVARYIAGRGPAGV
ncbi:VOC family protein [Streptomyces olivaceoviridis]|uniref:VOC family protein n=1 Tax=Streptomyces olivaceoviridis TaxID=1921 RepID=UPI00367B9534